MFTLRWRHNDLAGVSNHQPHGCLLNRLFRRRSNKTSKLRVTGLCGGIHRDRWIPRTKGQLRGKCFHLMTSSWVTNSSVDCISESVEGRIALLAVVEMWFNIARYYISDTNSTAKHIPDFQLMQWNWNVILMITGPWFFKMTTSWKCSRGLKSKFCHKWRRFPVLYSLALALQWRHVDVM